ncbi:hypothetical protein EYB25_005385 [Talaromyces marneffei]|uniref:NF-kappa-B inhibitor-like protein 1 n=2 Tax=Talaromyces marneffei TaxID=37727 RepID=B6QK71_TALMQ|nr:conserved hypothetical protein [Talaromyces marneffei ATCC 18224]KAE8551495.1 hypothetical protein EYB25_005385 [Talaromyces marneffei]
MDGTTAQSNGEHASNYPNHLKEEENKRTKDGTNESEYRSSRSSKFRFKSSKSRSRHHSSGDDRSHSDEHKSHRHRHHHHRHHHSSRRSPKRQKTEDEPFPQSPGGRRSLSPDTAFRESLFDALGDDEGAMYWESVYGQPIHTYAVPSVPKGPDGELERMTDEEYAEYVRARMWERSHEGIMHERERQRQEKAKAKKRAETEQQERSRFDEALEESLRRGEKRRRAKQWKAAWEKYLKSWEELADLAKTPLSSDTEKPFYIRNYIYWPVESGKRRDISRDEIRDFMQHSPSESFSNTLKVERIRWHPDKMLHRYGGLGLGEEKTLVQSVTEVFQILDDLWIEAKGRHTS